MRRHLLERVLKIKEKALGPEHTSVASTLHAIAQVRSKMDQNEEALALFERVLKIRRESLRAGAHISSIYAARDCARAVQDGPE